MTIEFGEAFYIKELPAEDRKRAGAYSEARIREMLVKEQEERRGFTQGVSSRKTPAETKERSSGFTGVQK